MNWALTAFLALPAAAIAAPSPVDTVIHLTLPPESDERRPLAVPTEAENTVELDFPWPVADWAGRGFTPDLTRFSGDFVIEARRGSARIFVTPVAAGAHRVLFVVLAPPGGSTRSVPVEFLAAPPGLAWRKAVFTDTAASGPAARSYVLSPRPPVARYSDPSPDSALGLLRTLRLMLNMTADEAKALAAANPALEMAVFDAPATSFGDFTLANRFAIRNSTTDELGLCSGVHNSSSRRLLFDPESWMIRVGDRIYPVRTVDFPAELDPGTSAPAFLILARGPNGERTRLTPDNAFEVSVRVAESADPRPVPPVRERAPIHR